MKCFFALLILLTANGGVRAEPMQPLLSKKAADSLRTRLWHSPSGRERVDQLVLLSTDILIKNSALGLPLDSLDTFIQQAVGLSQTLRYASGQIKSQYLRGRLLDTNQQFGEAQVVIRRALALCQSLKQPQLAAEGWFYLGNAYTRTDAEMPQRLRCYQQAVFLFRRQDDKARAAYVLKSIADMHSQQGQQAQARTELLEVLVLYRATGYRKLHYTFDLLSIVARKQNNFPEALQYRFAAIASAKASQDSSVLPLFYWQVGGLYDMLKQPAKGLENFRVGLAYAQALKSPYYTASLLGEIAGILISQHHAGEALTLLRQKSPPYSPSNYYTQFAIANNFTHAYLATRQFPLAEKSGLQVLSLITSGKAFLGDNTQLERAYLALSEVYVATRQYARARTYLSHALAANDKAGNASGTARTHLLLFKVDSAQGRFPAAIAHYQQYTALNDSLFNDKQSKLVAGFQIQFDTKRREQNIALLTKQTQVQQAQLRQRELQRNGWLAGAVLLALLLGVSFNRYRLKQRSSQLLEAKQVEINQKNQALELVVSEKDQLLEDKEWMLKEIHHRVKNNLQIITSLLHSQAVYLKDKAALSAIRESQNRVHSMALIHQKLYQGTQLASVPMQAYVHEIVSYLITSFDSQRFVRAELAVADVALDVSLAVPVGLILNEAITNSLKYAFPAQQPGL
ncbi:MAG: histidine kinase dimerization/phosphoacceptor domain -containing protein, partial [Janthinobacterium lividum]